jgi:hypothetical protein
MRRAATSQPRNASRRPFASPGRGCRPPAASAPARAPPSSTSPTRCSRASCAIVKAPTSRPLPHCAVPWRSRMRCPTTSPGAGCSPPAMRWVPCSSSRSGSTRPRPSIAPISASTRRCRGGAGTRTTLEPARPARMPGGARRPGGRHRRAAPASGARARRRHGGRFVLLSGCGAQELTTVPPFGWSTWPLM